MWDIWIVLGACEYINFRKLFYLLEYFIMQQKIQVYFIYWTIKWESSIQKN